MKTSTPKGISKEDYKAAQQQKDSTDFVYTTNQSLNTLKEGIRSLSSQHEKAIANNLSAHQSLLIDFENLKSNIDQSLKQFQKRVGSVEAQLVEALSMFRSLQESVEYEYLTKDSFSNAIAPECRKIDLIEKDLAVKNDYFNLALREIKCQFKDNLDALKKEMTPVIPEIDPVKKQLDERFKVLKVDLDGLTREINLLKRSSAYDEKKFENIYTLIKRLKGEKP